MIVYLDLCCLKRPFDDQTQPRIAMETSAVLAVLQAVSEGRLQAVRSLAHDVENSRNPDHRRAATVQVWLNTLNPLMQTPPTVAALLEEYAQEGLAAMDAFHLAWAEHLKADVLITTDRAFQSKSNQLQGKINVKVKDPIAFVAELNL